LLNIRPNEVSAIIQNTMSSYLYISKYFQRLIHYLVVLINKLKLIVYLKMR
jgi:hypothetical protein